MADKKKKQAQAAAEKIDAERTLSSFAKMEEPQVTKKRSLECLIEADMV